MPDLTVTWPGAVPFDQFAGKGTPRDAEGVPAADVHMAMGGFTVVPFNDTSFESAMKGAIPYAYVDPSTDEIEQAEEIPPAPVKRGRK